MKKKTSYILSTMLLFVMSLYFFTGCGTSTSTASKNVTESEVKTLTVWLPPLSAKQDDKAVWDEIMDPFELEYNVTVNVEIVPWGNYQEKYLTGITSGKGPDVGYMYMEMITDFIDMGALEPFDQYLTQEDKDNFLYLKNGYIQGKQYCLPIVVGNAVVMCYNKDILEDNGISTPPTTWDEFIEIAKKIKTDTNGDGKDDIYRFVQKWGNPAISTLNTSFTLSLKDNHRPLPSLLNISDFLFGSPTALFGEARCDEWHSEPLA